MLYRFVNERKWNNNAWLVEKNWAMDDTLCSALSFNCSTALQKTSANMFCSSSTRYMMRAFIDTSALAIAPFPDIGHCLLPSSEIQNSGHRFDQISLQLHRSRLIVDLYGLFSLMSLELQAAVPYCIGNTLLFLLIYVLKVHFLLDCLMYLFHSLRSDLCDLEEYKVNVLLTDYHVSRLHQGLKGHSKSETNYFKTIS